MILDLRQMARALNGEVVGGQVLAPGAGHGPRDRSLSVKLSASSPTGFLVHSFAGDDWRDCQAYVVERLGLPRDVWKGERKQADADLQKSVCGRHRRGRKMTTSRRGSPRARLLGRKHRSSRNHSRDLSALASPRPRRQRGRRGLAMESAHRRDDRAVPQHSNRRAAGGQPNVPRPRWTEDRTQVPRPRRRRGRQADADENVHGGLHIGEGVETCQAARQLDLRPTWALGSKGAIGAFPVVPGVEVLTILPESDAEREIEMCAARWDAAGREVIINRAIGGKDLNDSLRGAA